MRSLKNALRAAGRNETLSTSCTALETWVDNELNQFKGGNKDYRADAQQLAEQLKSCILAEAKYNSVKQTILSQADTGPTNSTTTFTFGLSGELLSETNTTTNTQKDYVYLNGKPLAMIKHVNNAGVITSQIYTIHNDHLGTPQAMTNSAGVTVWNASYGPFGKGTPNQDVNNDGNKVTLNIRFPGQYYDKEAGLHYNYFRVYDPNSGRYITSDPIGLLGGINRFIYTHNNPINYVDTHGLVDSTRAKLMNAIMQKNIQAIESLLPALNGNLRNLANKALKKLTLKRAAVISSAGLVVRSCDKTDQEDEIVKDKKRLERCRQAFLRCLGNYSVDEKLCFKAHESCIRSKETFVFPGAGVVN